LATSGCSGASKAGAAVIIGDERVPVSEVQKKVDNVMQQRARGGLAAEPAEQVTSAQVRNIIVARILAKAGEQVGVSASRAEIDAFKAQLIRQYGSQDALEKQLIGADIAPGDLDQAIRQQIVAGK